MPTIDKQKYLELGFKIPDDFASSGADFEKKLKDIEDKCTENVSQDLALLEQLQTINDFKVMRQNFRIKCAAHLCIQERMSQCTSLQELEQLRKEIDEDLAAFQNKQLDIRDIMYQLNNVKATNDDDKFRLGQFQNECAHLMVGNLYECSPEDKIKYETIERRNPKPNTFDSIVAWIKRLFSEKETALQGKENRVQKPSSTVSQDQTMQDDTSAPSSNRP